MVSVNNVGVSADNYESNVRVQALKDFMQELDTPYEENDFYYEPRCR